MNFDEEMMDFDWKMMIIPDRAFIFAGQGGLSSLHVDSYVFFQSKRRFYTKNGDFMLTKCRFYANKTMIIC